MNSIAPIPLTVAPQAAGVTADALAPDNRFARLRGRENIKLFLNLDGRTIRRASRSARPWRR